MGIQLPGALREAQAFVGLPFPSTNESALQGRASDWHQLASLAASTLSEIAQTAQSVSMQNKGEAVEAFAEFMASGGGNVGSLRDFQMACQSVAVAHHMAAMTIRSLKMAIIAQLSIVATAINVAKAVPQAIPTAYQVRQQAFMFIQQATQMAASQLRAG